MLAREMVLLKSTQMAAAAGIRSMSQLQGYVVDGDNQAIPLAALIAGLVRRTGATGATADTLPTVDSIAAALPFLAANDSFEFRIRQEAAQAITLTVGTGMTAVGTVNVAASNTRHYLLTMLTGAARTTILTGTTTSASKVLSGFTQTQLKAIQVGMLASGTNIAASSFVTAVNPAAGTVSIAVDATGTSSAPGVAITFTPQATLQAIATSAI